MEYHVKAWMGNRLTQIPLKDYLEICAMQHGFDGYEDMRRNGLFVDLKDAVFDENGNKVPADRMSKDGIIMEGEDTVGTYVKYTEEQKEAANAVPISAILDKEGERYKKRGSEFQWIRHDSLLFSGSKWYRYSEGQGGQAISFCKKFLNMSFSDAMEYLLEFCPSVSESKSENEIGQRAKSKGLETWKNAEKEELKTENRELKLPEKSETMKHVYWYLIRKRNIDPTILSYFVREDVIYEDAKWHGAVFLGKDVEGRVRHAHVRGTQDKDGRKFRMTVEGSDSRYGFGFAGPGNLLYVFEAPIDLLSFLCLYPKDWKQNSYVSLCGVSGNAVFQFMKDHPNIDGVVLCLDTDHPGRRACKRLADELREAGVDNDNIRRLRCHAKDWNEELCMKASMEQRTSAEDHAKEENTCSQLLS